MDEYLTTTTSMCRECGRLLPAQVHLRGEAVWFLKHCVEHGPQSALIRSDAEEYLGLARFARRGAMPMKFQSKPQGCPSSCGLCGDHEQHICLPIIEITDHCNLACPVCLVENRSTFHLSRRDVAEMLDRLIAAEGQIDVLNLSGGEPTVNPHFTDIVEECVSRGEILRTSVSTNGLRLLEEPGLFEFLAERNVIVSLQFDGVGEDAYRYLRGRPLLEEKLRVIEAAAQLDAPMSLTATVARGVNDHRLPEVLDILFRHDNIMSVMLQPVAYTGAAGHLQAPEAPVTIPDVVARLDGAFGATVSAADFSPLPCSHPACFSLAFFLRCDDGSFTSVKRVLPAGRYLDMIENRGLMGTDAESFEVIRDAVYDLWSGPAALSPDSDKALAAVKRIIKATDDSGAYSPESAFRAAERSVKSVFIHHFMDRNTFDLARARKCCNVYPRRDGRLVPVCVYNCIER